MERAAAAYAVTVRPGVPMRFLTVRLLLPLVLAVPVTAAGADTLPAYHRHHVGPVASARAPDPAPPLASPEDVTASPPAATPAPPAQLATPAPVVEPSAKPPAQAVGLVGVPPSPSQTR